MESSVRGDHEGLRDTPQSWGSAACPSPAFASVDVVLSLMCVFLGIFVLIKLFKGFWFFFCCLLLWFLQVTHLTIIMDSCFVFAKC